MIDPHALADDHVLKPLELRDRAEEDTYTAGVWPDYEPTQPPGRPMQPAAELRERIDALYARNLPFRSAAYRRGWERALDAVLELLP